MTKIFCSFILLLVAHVMLLAQQVFPLYANTIPNATDNNTSIPIIHAFIPSGETSIGTAVVIFPGGAYGFLALQEEGIDIARALVKSGIAAFVVEYRLPADAGMKEKSMGPLQDAQQAIRFVRQHAAEWKLDTSKVGVMGFSAGGHLAATLGTHFDISYIPNKENIKLRPDFMVLVYPLISMTNELTHQGSRINLLGNNPTKERVLFFSSETQVRAGTPPAYITHTEDDGIVPVENSIAFYEALKERGVPVEMHLYPTGNHGFIQRLPLHEWLDPILLWMTKGRWLKKKSSQPGSVGQ